MRTYNFVRFVPRNEDTTVFLVYASFAELSAVRTTFCSAIIASFGGKQKIFGYPPRRIVQLFRFDMGELAFFAFPCARIAQSCECGDEDMTRLVW